VRVLYYTNFVAGVIGAPLRDVLIHASTTITIGEHQHDVPTLVVACVEELTRTGTFFLFALP
jgi:hypothetical protein